MNHILSLIFSSFAWRSLAKALVFAVLALSISACDVLDDDDDDDANSAPTSNAGTDQTVNEGSTVTLDGSGSSDSDGSISSYAWSQTSGGSVDITNASSASATFTAPDVSENTALIFRLTVTDDDGATATDEVTITVNHVNVAPTANAGDDEEKAEGSVVTLGATGSSDSDGSIVSYSWSQSGGDNVEITNASSASATFDAPYVASDTELVFSVTVTDNEGASATDEVAITVTNETTEVPQVSASADASVDEGETVELTGSATDDGIITSYLWAELNDEVDIDDADQINASFIAPYVGTDGYTLEFNLTATDDDNNVVTSEKITITIVNTTSAVPTVNAGDDQSVFEGSEVALSGSAEDDGVIVGYSWEPAIISGDNTAVIELVSDSEDTNLASFVAPEVDQDTQIAFYLTATDEDGHTGTSAVIVDVLNYEPSSQVLFASQYELTGNGAEPFAISEEDGDVYSFSGGDFYYTWGLGENSNYMIQRQAYGLQFNHAGAIDDNSFFGLAFKAPGNSYVDISESDTLVIQMGNGANTTDFPNSHMIFTIELNGGGYIDNAWSASCNYDQSLYDGSRPLNNEGGTNETWGNPYGIHTYRVVLADFNCTSGDMSTLGDELEEVVVKVVGGKDEIASETEGNQVLLQVGYIGFSNDTESVSGNGVSNYMLFASQYELIGGATGEPYVISDESGEVHSFSGGGLTYSWGLGENADYLVQRQAYGLQFDHNNTIDGNSYFGLAFKAPNNSALDMSGTDTLVIQTGNGTNSDSFANSHMVFMLELNGGGSSCIYELTLDDGSRPGTNQAAWTNPFGIHSYYVDLALFTCSSGNMGLLSVDLQEVVVKVVGGLDETASATENNQVLMQIGYIAFATTDDDDEDNVDPTADAGIDQKVDEGDEVTLVGSGSDTDGNIASYAWTQVTDNSEVTLSGADTATASFTAPLVDAETQLVFRLTVTDDKGATATDSVTITITDTDLSGDVNVAPTANAGDDQEVNEGDEVTLAGSGPLPVMIGRLLLQMTT